MNSNVQDPNILINDQECRHINELLKIIKDHDIHNQCDQLSPLEQIDLIKENILNLKKIKLHPYVEALLFTEKVDKEVSKKKSLESDSKITFPIKLNHVTMSYLSMIPEPSEGFQLHCVSIYPQSIKKLKKQTQLTQQIALSKNLNLIRFCKDPSFETQRYAVTNNKNVIEYIKDPHPEVVDIALNYNPLFILKVKNPTDDQIIKSLKSSKNDFVFSQLINPNQRIVEEACRAFPYNLRYVKNQTLELCLEVLESENAEIHKLYRYVTIVDNPSHLETINNLKKRLIVMEGLK